MPYYSCLLRATSFRGGDSRLLQNAQPPGIQDQRILRQLISRQVRENCFLWAYDNVVFPAQNLEAHVAVDRIRHTFATCLEVMAAAELCNEDMYLLFGVKHILMKAMQLMDKIALRQLHDEVSELNVLVWEVHNALAGKSDGSEVQLSNPRGYLLWAQSFIKLARTYYFPSQTNDAADTTDYFLCFEYAFAKFHQCIKASQKLLDLHVEAQRLSLGGVHREFISPQMQRNLLSDGQMHALVQLQADSWSGIGYGNLMMARTLKDAEKRRPQLIEAKKMFNKAESLSPSLNSTYNLACIGALLEDEYECKEWLMLALKDKSLPKPDYLSQDPDLTKFRGTPWFQQISEANRSRYESESKSSLAAGAKSVVNPGDMYLPFSVDVKPSAPVTGGSSPQGKPADLSRSEAIYQDAIDFDPDLNKLQASLLREGFSILTVKQMIIEVSKGKKTQQQDAEKIRVQKERLHERLKKYQLKEKSPIPADGNCQFHSVSDQLFDTIEQSGYVRRKVVEWLRANPDWLLPNGACMRDFVHSYTWEEYCNEISREGIWGDHLTLLAITEIFGTRICIVSSVESDNHVTEIAPKKIKSDKILFLSHYAEFHYGSLTRV